MLWELRLLSEYALLSKLAAESASSLVFESGSPSA